VLASLDDDKAEDVVVIDLADKTSIADFMVVASGRSTRQVTTLADHLAEKLKAVQKHPVSIEGKTHGDWVLVDGGDVIVHIFRPEVRAFYGLEKMWSALLDEPAGASEAVAAGA
jgi:ribosome-associated protein